MIRSAAQLIRRQGVSGTGLRQVVTEAGAPRGSLQHYFPEGKEQLVVEALRWMGAIAIRRVTRSMDGRTREGRPPERPSALLEALVEYWRRDLEAEGYLSGCPLVAAAADVASESDRIRGALGEAFDGWQLAIGDALGELDVGPERAPGLATLVVSAIEGAIVLARIRRDLGPFDALVAELGPVLDAAVGPGPGPTSDSASAPGSPPASAPG